jgi:hypothetical protein
VATDKLIHKLATTHPAAILKLFKIPDHDDYKASSFTFKEIENRRDIIFEKITGDEAILLETQGYDDAYFYHRTVIGRMMYHIQKQFTGKLRTVVIFLEQSHYHAASKLAHHFDGSTELAFQPTIIILNQKEIAELESFDDVRLVPLYPLCKISRKQIKEAALKWAERIKTTSLLSEKERHDLIHVLTGFLAHRLPDLSLKQLNQLLGGIKMEDTRAGKDLIAIGVRQTLRDNLIDLIQAKLGRVEKSWRTQLSTINKISTLKTLYRAVLQAKSHKQVQAAFDAVLGNGKKVNRR